MIAASLEVAASLGVAASLQVAALLSVAARRERRDQKPIRGIDEQIAP